MSHQGRAQAFSGCVLWFIAGCVLVTIWMKNGWVICSALVAGYFALLFFNGMERRRKG